MKYKRCPICEENLRNGVCPMCGYDFKRLESGCKNPDLHRDVVKRDAKKQSKTHQGKKKKSKIKWLIIIFVLLNIFGDFVPGVIGVIYDIKDEIVYRITGEDPVSQDSDSDHDPYEFVTYDLSEEGDHFETKLSAGEYIVGVDLPEGIYEVSSEEGKNSLTIYNRQQNISEYDFYKKGAGSDNEGYNESMEVRLYQGTYLKIDYSGILKFTTDSAQTDDQQQRVKNSLTKSVDVKKTMTAGKDFPEGTYDIYCLAGRGAVQTKYQAEEDGYEHTETYQLEKKTEENSLFYPEVQKQIYFYPGMKIVPDEKSMDIKLVPSKGTLPEGFKVYRYYEDVENE